MPPSTEGRKRRSVCVVGGGVIGLSTAYVILSHRDDVDVTIIADKFSPDTTGDVSAGFWCPFKSADTPTHLMRKWGGVTQDYLLQLYQTPDATAAGISLLTTWSLFPELEKDPYFADLTIDYHRLSPAEISKRGFDGAKLVDGYSFVTTVCECRNYLPWLTKKYVDRGGKLIKKRINSFDELYQEYDVIVNCTGISASSLVDDKHLAPYRGQVIRVYAPWIKHCLFVGDDTYIIPNSECVILGGTAQRGNFNTSVDPADAQGILNRCAQFEPSLKQCKVLSHDVGLRPVRTSVRLEAETVKVKDKLITIVHNYGHGGSGVTLHWGCAQDAAALVNEALRQVGAAKANL